MHEHLRDSIQTCCALFGIHTLGLSRFQVLGHFLRDQYSSDRPRFIIACLPQPAFTAYTHTHLPSAGGCSQGWMFTVVPPNGNQTRYDLLVQLQGKHWNQHSVYSRAEVLHRRRDNAAHLSTACTGLIGGGVKDGSYG